MATNILIESIDGNGKKLQKAVTNVNPTASNTDLKNFAEQLNALTNNTYVGTVKVDREDISDGSKTAPTVSWQNPQNGTITFSTFYQQLNSMKFTYCIFDLTGVTFAEGTTFAVKSTFDTMGGVAVVIEGGSIQLQIGVCAEELDSTPSAGSFTVFIPETTTSAATTAVLTVTV